MLNYIHRYRLDLTIFIFLALSFCGCGKKGLKDPYAPVLKTPPTVTRQVSEWSVQGRPIETFVIGSGDETVFILAAIHGDEPATPVLADRIISHLLMHRYMFENYTIVLLPRTNPDGLAGNSRFNARNIDLNRNFATSNRIDSFQFGTALSEPEARLIANLINTYRPARIISIHQPLACIDYDGPAEQLAWHISIYANLPVRKLGAQPGSLGSYAGDILGIPIITLELTAGDTNLDADSLWSRYGPAIVAGITYPHRIK